ncbi:TPA: phage portal protein [Streptococcus suis]
MLEEFIDSFGNPKKLNHRFHRESTIRYRVQDLESLIQNEYSLLKQYIEHHRKYQRPRIQELYDYATGRNHLVSAGERRRESEDMVDSRAIHNFGGAISVFKQGYLAGNPIRADYIDTDPEATLAINEYFKTISDENDFYELNRELIMDLSQVGRSYDIVYRSEQDVTKVRHSNPLETFVIYDFTKAEHSVAAVRYYSINMFDSTQELVELYTDLTVTRFNYTNGQLLQISDPEPHAFGDIPITEYLNNKWGMGDYESVITLIDLYDAAQSDTANYMSDLADAILAIFGKLEIPGTTLQEKQALMKTMRKARLMLFEPSETQDGVPVGNVDAKYLFKQYDVAGTEAYKSRLRQDIMALTNKPDMTDENFSGNASGEALVYKLFGLDQERINTQGPFEKSLKRRFELVATIAVKAKEIPFFVRKQLKITFTPNLPKSLEKQINNLKSLGGMLSNETALALTGLVDDVSVELEKLAQEANPTDTLPTYDEAPKVETKKMYGIQSIVSKFKRGQISQKVAIKLFDQLGVGETEANEYLDLESLIEGVELDDE